MAIRLDPEGTEKSLLFAMTGGFAGKRVLEVGCGAGRLTWRYAEQAQSVVGIDPNGDTVAEARASAPLNLQDKVVFYPLGIFDYAPGHGTEFDVVILSWSL